MASKYTLPNKNVNYAIDGHGRPYEIYTTVEGVMDVIMFRQELIRANLFRYGVSTRHAFNFEV